MITVEDKIRTFSKYVYDKQDRLSKQMIKELEDKNKQIIEQKQKDLQAKCDDLKENMRRKAEQECKKIISNAKLKARDRILNAKNELLNNFIKEISCSLYQFTQQKEYKAYMQQMLNKASDFLKKGDVKVYLVQKDIQLLADKIKSEYPHVEIIRMSDENIGGAIIESVCDNQRIDLSFKRKINDWKGEIGLRLYDALEK